MKYIYGLLFAIILTGCQDSSQHIQTDHKDQNAQSPHLSTPPFSPTISLRPTLGLETAEPIITADFMPNLAVSWLGQVIMLGESGTLYHARINAGAPKIVAMGPYKDIRALARESEPAAFVAINKMGQADIFIESDDEGHFKSFPIADSPSLEGFCRNGDASLIIRSGDTLYDIIIDKNETARLVAKDGSTIRLAPCLKNAAPIANGVLKTNAPHQGLTFLANGKEDIIELTDALSVKGIVSARFVEGTYLSMGSTFNDGAIIVADATAPYIVIIARPYLEKALGSPE